MPQCPSAGMLGMLSERLVARSSWAARLSSPTLALMGHGDIESVAGMSGSEIAGVVLQQGARL